VPVSESETLGVYHFGYLVTHGARTGLIQVFDDGQMTFVQFLPSKGIREKERTFYSPKEEREIEKVGDVRNQVSLKGVYEEFHVVHEGRVTTVQRVSERK
jgi:hypothetical protein